MELQYTMKVGIKIHPEKSVGNCLHIYSATSKAEILPSAIPFREPKTSHVKGERRYIYIFWVI
jgi:hypothetical protein